MTDNFEEILIKCCVCVFNTFHLHRKESVYQKVLQDELFCHNIKCKSEECNNIHYKLSDGSVEILDGGLNYRLDLKYLDTIIELKSLYHKKDDSITNDHIEQLCDYMEDMKILYEKQNKNTDNIKGYLINFGNLQLEIYRFQFNLDNDYNIICKKIHNTKKTIKYKIEL